MPISKAMQRALRAISDAEPDLARTYRLARAAKDLAHPPTGKLLYKTWDVQIPCRDHLVPVRLFAPRGKDKKATGELLLFFHGGGWVTGSIDSYDRTCRVMAQRTGRPVASVDYRLAPEYPFPAGLEDCYAVARQLFLHGAPFGADPRQIVLVGDSAGGNLAAAVSLLARDRGEFLPRRQILIYPALAADHSPSAPYASLRSNGQGYLLTARRVQAYLDLYLSRPQDRQSPYFAPLLAQDLSRQPDTLLLTAELCPLRDEGEDYGKRLRQAGSNAQVVRVADTLHGYFTLSPRFAPVRHTYEIINNFLERGTQ